MVTQRSANGARPPAVKMIAATVVPLRETDDSRRMPGEWVGRASSRTRSAKSGIRSVRRHRPTARRRYWSCRRTSRGTRTLSPWRPSVSRPTRRSASTHGRPPRTRSPWRCATSAPCCGRIDRRLPLPNLSHPPPNRSNEQRSLYQGLICEAAAEIEEPNSRGGSSRLPPPFRKES
jgi:hypothetical protein